MTNNLGDIMNFQIILEFKAIESNYFSIDTVVDNEESIHFPTEFLNLQIPSDMIYKKYNLRLEF